MDTSSNGLEKAVLSLDGLSKTVAVRREIFGMPSNPEPLRDRSSKPRGSIMDDHDSQDFGQHFRETSRSSTAQTDDEFLHTLQRQLHSAYKEQRQAARTAVGELCADIVRKSCIPHIEEQDAAPSPFESVEEARERSEVLREFNKAVGRLQTGAIPTKRRGNLPKECISYLKTWCCEHYENPYPSDVEKMEMSRRTQVDVSQISHWFINYRKRIWKPNLPPDHPALDGRIKKKARR